MLTLSYIFFLVSSIFKLILIISSSFFLIISLDTFLFNRHFFYRYFLDEFINVLYRFYSFKKVVASISSIVFGSNKPSIRIGHFSENTNVWSSELVFWSQDVFWSCLFLFQISHLQVILMKTQRWRSFSTSLSIKILEQHGWRCQFSRSLENKRQNRFDSTLSTCRRHTSVLTTSNTTAAPLPVVFCESALRGGKNIAERRVV